MPLTIPDLHSNEELRRHEFPVAESDVFLAHGAVCPLPRRVATAITDAAVHATLHGQESPEAAALVGDVRIRAARLVGADPSEIALVGPTSLALSYVAGGLPVRRGDNVVVYFDDYPSNVYPWMALSDRGVEVRFLNVKEAGKVRAVEVQGQVDERTRLVAISSAHFVTGWRTNVDAIGRYLRARHILFCVDAIQSLGAFPLSVEHVDFLAADAHKWLLGPCGAGIFLVKRDMQELLKPIVHGWHNVKCPDFLATEEMVYRKDARKYEVGTHNLVGLAGLRAALELAEEIGVRSIGMELARQRARLVPMIQAKGYTVLLPEMPAENVGAMVSFHRPGSDMAAVVSGLAEAGVKASLRSLRGGPHVARFAPHYYNTDAELDRAVELLP